MVVALCVCGAAAAVAQPSEAAPPPGPAFASIADSSLGGDESSRWNPFPRRGAGEAIFFVVQAVDGQPVNNSLQASRSQSFGLGSRMRVAPFERHVPAGAVRLRLSALVAFAAPIETLLQRRRAFQAEGDVDVVLRPGGRYRVTGLIDSYRREVWLEDLDTRRVVGAKVVAPLDPEIAAQMEGADRYTCCNVRYDDRWISDSNILSKPFVPAGARVKVVDYGRNRVNVLIDGRPTSAGPDHGYEKMTREQFGDALFVREDPTLRLATWPPDVQAAIREGKVMLGMTREQVTMSLGRPRPTPAMEARGRWVYFVTPDDDFDLEFGPDGAVSRVNANRRIQALVVHEPAGR